MTAKGDGAGDMGTTIRVTVVAVHDAEVGLDRHVVVAVAGVDVHLLHRLPGAGHRGGVELRGLAATPGGPR